LRQIGVHFNKGSHFGSILAPISTILQTKIKLLGGISQFHLTILGAGPARVNGQIAFARDAAQTPQKNRRSGFEKAPILIKSVGNWASPWLNFGTDFDHS